MSTRGQRAAFLGVVFVVVFGVAALVVHPWRNDDDSAGGSATHRTGGAVWLYETQSAYVLMHGASPVVRIRQLPSSDGSSAPDVQWSGDGHYVAFLNDALVRQQPASQVKLVVVDTNTGVRKLLPCPGCDGIVAVEAHDVLAEVVDSDASTTVEVLYDLASGRRHRVDLNLPPVQYSVWEPFGGAGRNLLVSNTITSGLDTNKQNLLLNSIDGSTQVSLGSYESNEALLGYLTESRGTTTAVVGLRSNPGECTGTMPVNVFAVDQRATNVAATSFLAAQPAGTSFGRTSGFVLDDLWRNVDGSTWATVVTWGCNDSARDEQSKMVLARHSSLWRLQGYTWKPVAPVAGLPSTVTQARQIGTEDFAVLDVPDCVGPQQSHVPVGYCSTGNLTRVHDGKNTRIAGDVLRLSSPSNS